MSALAAGRCLFVCGAHRTGTTLLARLLCTAPTAHPQLRESEYPTALVQAWAVYRTRVAEDTHYFDSAADALSHHRGVLTAFLERVRHRHGGPRDLVLKDPNLTRVLPALHELLPDARLLVMMRDPRDAVASFLEAARREQGARAHAYASLGARDHARSFSGCYAALLHAGDRDAALRARVQVVPYEELVRHPADVLADLRMVTGLELPADAHLRAPAALPGGLAPIDAAWQTEPFTQPVTDTRIGRHRQTLSTAEIAAVEDECRALMQRFGYA